MQVFAVITVARQIEGEYIAIRTDKAFKRASHADAELKKLKEQFTAPDGKINPQNITTPQGDIECFCEVGVFEIEINE